MKVRNATAIPLPLSSLFFLVFALAVLTLTSFYSYLMFHVLAEFFSIIVAGCIFVMAWNGRRLIDNNYLLIVGIAFGFIGAMDLLHTLSYSGMGIIEGYTADLATQLWIAARYMEAFTFLAALFFLNRKIAVHWILLIYSLVTTLLLLMLYWKIFPACFTADGGLTPFKVVSEYLISAILLASLLLLIGRRDAFNVNIRFFLVAAIGCTIASEIAFTAYVNIYGISNMAGHLLKVAAFYLFYKAMIETAFVQPSTLLFARLDNRRQVLEKSADALEQQARDQSLALATTAATLSSQVAEKERKEQLYRRVGDLIPFGIWTCDPAGEIMYLSDSFLEMLGMTLAECRRQGWQDRMMPNDAAAISDRWEQCMKTGETWDKELRFLDKNGDERYVISRGVPFYDDNGSILYWGGINLDITERKAMKATLDRERKRFYFVLEKLPAFVCLKTADHAIPYANRFFRERFGDPEKQACYQIMHNRREPCGQCRADSVMAYQEPMEWDWQDAPDGRIYRVYGYPFEDMDGTPMMLQMGVDITDRVAAEEQMTRYSLQLERSNRDLQDFAYVASHDLQEPLRKITTFGNRIRNKYADHLDEKGLDYLQRMENAATRMRRMITALLEYSRVTTRQRPFAIVDLKELIYDVIDDIEDQVKRTKATIEVGALDTIEADPVQMRQLFQNLISNSMKFCDKPAPVVAIEGRMLDHSRTPVDSLLINAMQLKASPLWYQVLVRDNGIGFDESYMDRIFSPFQRLHSRQTYSGTGIGLSICQKIIERHGGTITAKSEPGAGSTFVVTLPMKQPRENQYETDNRATHDRPDGGR